MVDLVKKCAFLTKNASFGVCKGGSSNSRRSDIVKRAVYGEGGDEGGGGGVGGGGGGGDGGDGGDGGGGSVVGSGGGGGGSGWQWRKHYNQY